MKIDLKYKNKKIKFDVKRCNLFWMVKGLMFVRCEKAKALLLFDFKKPRRMKIHSFFCPRFVAVWLDEKDNVIEVKMVKPWRSFVLPRKKFSRLVEIPCSGKYEDIVRLLVGDGKHLNSK